MSIVVKGMKMPMDCPQCPCAYYADHSTFLGCNAKPGKRYAMRDEEYRNSSTRPDWCPLVEVKTPHGRLIDADILYEKFAELDAQALDYTCKLGEIELNEEWQKWSAILYERSAFKHDVYKAPTIIEAEE